MICIGNAERLFAWLQNFSRLVVRYEYHVENFLTMFNLGYFKILLRFFLRWVVIEFLAETPESVPGKPYKFSGQFIKISYH